ncbi:MAG: DNA-directed RNA polymerase subunit alpha [bacterium]
MKLLPFKMPQAVEVEKSTDEYGKFIFSPLEPGFGMTIGNSLRRILLSSIQGAAISAIKFDNVPHEFSTIPGVYEDMSQIILNLKKINIKLINKLEKKLSLKINKKGEIKAGDIKEDSECEIINPEQLILTVTDDIKDFSAELFVTTGRGYVAAEFLKKESEVGLIYLDAFYSPVRRVKYKIDHTRIERRTDYDKLILEVWTNGQMIPEDAVSLASTIANDHFNIFTLLRKEEEIERVQEMDETEKKLRDTLAIRIDGLELSVRAHNCLKAAEIGTLGDLVQKTEADMLQYPNFGRKSLAELIELLARYNLIFGAKLPFKIGENETRE